MPVSIIILDVLCVLFATSAIFLGLEFKKKFGFMANFARNSNQLLIWKSWGSKKPGMHNIILRGNRPFCALVGFQLNVPMFGMSGFDYYGFVKSNDQGVAVISTYIGKGECEFLFFVNTDLNHNSVVASSTERDQLHTPDVTYPPHWWQRLGIFA